MSKLGVLERVDPRVIWADEARDFTPWLVENIRTLSDALGMDLEVAESEGVVGGFRVDIVCNDLATGKPVVIENILGSTDHDHLGKLITYAAGRNARAAILIATDFRDEHCKALEWLNEVSGKDHLFFGVKAEVLRIGDSLPAPNFDLIVQPNEWANEVTSPTPSPKLKAYEGFFTGLLAKVKQRLPGFTSASKGLPQSWFSFPAGRTGFVYSVAFRRQSKMSVDLYIDVGDADKNKAVFDRFFSEKDAIEAEFGQALSWERLDNFRASRIAVYEPGSIDDDPQTLDNLGDEAVQLLDKFTRAFRQRIISLPKTSELASSADQ